jgi:hypothetical protein
MRNLLITAALLGAVTLAAIGCSESNPVAPTNDTQSTTAYTLLADSVHFAACVATVDQNRRMLTFEGRADTVIAAHDCNIIRLKGNTEAPAPFTSIRPGDSLDVHGTRNMNREVYAYRLQICPDTRWDVAFRDTISSIDYAAGSFTVVGRPETILVDEDTYIWGNILTRQEMIGNRYENQYRLAQAAEDGYRYRYARRDTALVFSDLKVGDVVEVRTVVVDPGTLRAVFIKVANCTEFADRCVQFEATIASIDPDTRAVTFVGLDWNGVVCKGARLTDADGNPITLADFAVGLLVAVKGHPVDDVLQICQMSIL